MIDQDDCVECEICQRSGVCPEEVMPHLEWPRVLRNRFSNPLVTHPDTQVTESLTDRWAIRIHRHC